ncbi:hypothetical protein NOK12_05470 [Nocardioides sp. OK12]|uniref:Uncharacterized protein n=1 Tax=Nocardioides marinisabuli TaxID=419476 RepID=A0A7Y9F2J4_9ACTN|nr:MULTISPECIES: hypothetical protein [Nocardioides]NYD58354.1 hypothetical protein [Nocardioides marinisabuli]GHJ58028.1 hypothetical protein NOK12_05470 [Nocardioides sp. OK12]
MVTTDDDAVAPTTPQDTGPDTASDTDTAAGATAGRPSWWHRDHPVFTPLSGFFSGLLFVLLVPSVYAAVLNAVTDDETATDLFPFVLVALAVPLGLVVAPHTRRFGRYMLFGVVSTAVVVLGVAALVVWVLVSRA